MADSLRNDNAAVYNKRAARSEKMVIVGKYREEKGERKRGRDEARRRKVGREEDPCHTRTTDSRPLLLYTLIPAIHAQLSHCAFTNEHHSHKSKFAYRCPSR